jgi:hypothetical protein
MTRCNLIFIWMVKSYNLERVMCQFNLHQDVPPPVPRQLKHATHK